MARQGHSGKKPQGEVGAVAGVPELWTQMNVFPAWDRLEEAASAPRGRLTWLREGIGTRPLIIYKIYKQAVVEKPLEVGSSLQTGPANCSLSQPLGLINISDAL